MLTGQWCMLSIVMLCWLDLGTSAWICGLKMSHQIQLPRSHLPSTAALLQPTESPCCWCGTTCPVACEEALKKTTNGREKCKYTSHSSSTQDVSLDLKTMFCRKVEGLWLFGDLAWLRLWTEPRSIFNGQNSGQIESRIFFWGKLWKWNENDMFCLFSH